MMTPETKKQLIDQSAHLAIGSVATVLLRYLGIGEIASVCIVMSAALLREILQHSKWPWQLHKGSALDLFYWFSGCGWGLILWDWIK